MAHATCDCAEQIAKAYLAHNGHPAPDDNLEIFQTSLMSGLIAGVYESEMTLGELFSHGDFGLGTFNDLDGELIAFDKEAHHLRSDGSASPTTPDQKTPFAVVTEFKPSVSIELEEGMDSAQIETLIDRIAPSDNHFCTIRIDGEFELVSTRTVPRQERPYKPMLEAIAEQPTFDFKESRGTMAGFRTPSYLQGVNVAGYHIHYITDERDGGGHVLEYKVKHGTLQLGVIRNMKIDLPKTDDFMQADLNPADIDEAIRQAEA